MSKEGQKEKKKEVKKRYWAFVLYLESAPADWREQLQFTGLPCAISPYHDSDIDPTGSPKKPHYHIILAYSGPTTFDSVKRLTDSLNQPIPMPLESISGMYRYHTHMDNPEKAQYCDSDRTFLNGFAISDYMVLTEKEQTDLKMKIQDLIQELDIIEYAQLLDYLRANDMRDEYVIAVRHTLLFDKYITSRRYWLSTNGGG